MSEDRLSKYRPHARNAKVIGSRKDAMKELVSAVGFTIEMNNFISLRLGDFARDFPPGRMSTKIQSAQLRTGQPGVLWLFALLRAFPRAIENLLDRVADFFSIAWSVADVHVFNDVAWAEDYRVRDAGDLKLVRDIS